jgi:hypothetical protein
MKFLFFFVETEELDVGIKDELLSCFFPDKMQFLNEISVFFIETEELDAGF